MELRILVTCCLFQCIVIRLVSGDHMEEAKQHCKFVELSNTWWHKGLEGVYAMKDPEKYSCNNRTVYKQDSGTNMLFFITQNGWQGWMVGEHECLNKGYLSVTDNAMYIDEVNSTWEEFNSMKWLFNEDVISGCHIPGVTRPPRITQPMKTKHPRNITKPNTNVSLPVGVTVISPVSQGGVPPSIYTIVLYVVLPVGCLAILILILALCALSITQKSFLKKFITPEPDPDRVFLDGNRAKGRGRNHESSNHDIVLPALSLPRPRGDDQGSVYEILTEPEDARHSNRTTPVPPRRDGAAM